MAKKSFARRDFLKRALTAGTAAAAIDTPPQAAATVKWTRQADVIVFGAGAVGFAAAIEAAEQGASVLVVEANRDVGGHAVLSAGTFHSTGEMHREQVPEEADGGRRAGGQGGPLQLFRGCRKGRGLQ